MSPSPLKDFIRESNRIEGIHREVRGSEIDAHVALLAAPALSVDVVQAFVWAVAAHELREHEGMNVRVGSHVAPRGGPEIRARLTQLLADFDKYTAYAWHQQYEKLHPFMDGNGRSGRALWLRKMGGVERAPLGFLHHWYYQSLSEYRTPASP